MQSQTKGPHLIDLGGETPEKPPTGRSPLYSQSNIETSPLDVDISPSQPKFEISSPQQDFRDNPRKISAEIDPNQDEMYDYIESLEKRAIGPSTSSSQPPSAQDIQIQSLKHEIFELEVLNRHIKHENEALKEKK